MWNPSLLRVQLSVEEKFFLIFGFNNELFKKNEVFIRNSTVLPNTRTLLLSKNPTFLV